ncbi:triose-phosphate isomerase family protein [Streptomyces sp. TRM 70351]|uniref:triose-phosphate isomerase n=1 Tax=Streptomyces sp. TRM 70351 TaxID=3116552 RepID=UPI002E7B4709|nr:triose-phosphate isomerase family protein [Streptomyces sp. TRM 70351]MEE1930377.1 triose-phosphate isomerase family protein [Streptomyces sp. TRM 70351]
MKTPPTPLSCTSTKMNLGLADTLRWLHGVILPHAPSLARLSFFACLPYPLLPIAQARLGDCGVTAGAQDCWPEGGAVTGEVSAELLAEIGCRHVMLGHAERRRLFGEDDDLIARKVTAASEAGLVPLLCVGEDTRLSAQDAARHVVRQAAVLTRLRPGRPSLVLYEPAWAIGSDHGASPDHAAHVLQSLHTAIGNAHTRYLYGGSVMPGTYTALRQAAPWDGVAIGRAAQDPGMLHEVTAELLNPGQAQSS